MTYVLPHRRVTEAIYRLLQTDPVFLALAAGGVFSDVPEDPSYPFLYFEVLEQKQWGGFGTRPGLGTLPQLLVRLHAISLFQGGAQCQAILARAITLLAEAPSVTGYSAWAIFHDETLPLSDQILSGVKVKELVSQHRLYVEEA